MPERKGERAFVTEVFGRTNSVDNLVEKIIASIYHSLRVHNPVSDEHWEGVKANLMRLTTPQKFDEIIKKVDLRHENFNQHTL